MRSLVLAAAWSLPMAVLLVPALARAQAAPGVFTTTSGESPHAGPTIVYTRAPQPPASAWETKGMAGLELMARGGVMYAGGESPVQAPSLYPSGASGNPTGSILNPASCPAGHTCTPYGPDPFGLAVALGWRFLPQLSAGAFFSYAYYSAQNSADAGDAPDGTSNLKRAQFVVGAYARYYLTQLHPKLQPWVELGVGYSYDQASYQRSIGLASNAHPETGEFNLNNKGLAIPLTIGLDWRLAPAFSVGPMFGYEPVIPLGGCVEVDVDQYSASPGQNTCDSGVVTTKYYGVITGGIFAKVTFGTFAR